jgi:hypothetical protein
MLIRSASPGELKYSDIEIKSNLVYGGVEAGS